MFGNIILGLTFLTYLVLLFVSFNNGKPTGHYDFMFGFFILVVYAVLSLILTVTLTAKGDFNWMSNSTLWRNVGVGVLWLGMMAGVVICSITKMEVRFGDQLQGITRLFFLLIYYGGFWLPLLMLLSYMSILNPEGRFAISPNIVKMLLFLGCAIGFVTLATQKKIRTPIRAQTPNYDFNITVSKIYKDQSLINALYYIGDKDKRLHDASMNKIKQQKNYEDEFQKIFEKKLMNSIAGIYRFWDEYKVEHPEQFVSLINNNFPQITSELEEAIVNPYEAGFPINVERLCRVLDKQFKNSPGVFRPNMLKIQEVLAVTPAKRERGDTQDFVETLNTYRIAVKNWLDKNQ